MFMPTSDEMAQMSESEDPVNTSTQVLEDSESAEYSQFTESPWEESLFWGRLYPLRMSVRSHDLVFDTVKIGKDAACDITIGSGELPKDIMSFISKEQFIITRQQVYSLGAMITRVYLTALGANVTFINGQRLRKSQRKLLKSNDVIAIAKPEFTIYVFMESNLPVASSVPSSVKRKYDVSLRLGNGAFGDVSLVFNKVSCTPLAMKSIIKGLNLNENRLENSLKKLENELCILQEVNHPNVIRLVDVVDCKREKYLILEYMEGKDLFHRIKEQKKLSEDLAKLYFFQISCGVEYLHSKGIIHRDLKPANILLASPRNETIVKITDFGLSKILNSHTLLQTLCGTKMYVAPEVLLCAGMYEYTEQVDIWSMGVILYVCLSGMEPFSVQSNMEEQIKKAMYSMPACDWDNVSTQAKSLIDKMMTLDAHDRITISGILNDCWLNDDHMKKKVYELKKDHQNYSRTNSDDSTVSSSTLSSSFQLDLSADVNSNCLCDSILQSQAPKRKRTE